MDFEQPPTIKKHPSDNLQQELFSLDKLKPESLEYKTTEESIVAKIEKLDSVMFKELIESIFDVSTTNDKNTFLSEPIIRVIFSKYFSYFRCIKSFKN